MTFAASLFDRAVEVGALKRILFVTIEAELCIFLF
jgi:hypothetical protein